jgi:hypothetical protein
MKDRVDGCGNPKFKRKDRRTLVPLVASRLYRIGLTTGLATGAVVPNQLDRAWPCLLEESWRREEPKKVAQDEEREKSFELSTRAGSVRHTNSHGLNSSMPYAWQLLRGSDVSDYKMILNERREWLAKVRTRPLCPSSRSPKTGCSRASLRGPNIDTFNEPPNVA